MEDREESGLGCFASGQQYAVNSDSLEKGPCAADMVIIRVGEREVRVWRRGLATSNNVGLVSVEPDDEGGHVVRLTVHQYDEREDRLHATLTDVAEPGRT